MTTPTTAQQGDATPSKGLRETPQRQTQQRQTTQRQTTPQHTQPVQTRADQPQPGLRQLLGRQLLGRQLLGRWLPESWLISQQRIDPLGALAAWPLAPIVAVVLFVYAAVSTALHSDQMTQWVAAIAAVVLVAASGALHMWAARRASAGYTWWMYLVVITLACCAMTLEVVSTWGENRLVQDDFGHFVVAIMLVAGAPYRPALQLALSAVAAAILAGALAILQDPYFIVLDVPLLERAVVVVVPVLGLGLAGAVYADQLVRSVLRWQGSLSTVFAEHEREGLDGLVRTVQQEHVATLSDEVLPFLAGVAAAQVLTSDDVARARRLARAVRSSLVAELNNSWLEQLSAQLASEPSTQARPQAQPLQKQQTQQQQQAEQTRQSLPDSSTPATMRLHVNDEQRRASRMHGELRTALAALLSEVFANRELAASAASVDVTPDAVRPASRAVVTLRVQLRAQGQHALAVLRPYLHVVQLASEKAQYSLRGGELHVLFSYDHDPSGKQHGRRPAKR